MYNVNSSTPKEKKRIAQMIREAYESKGQSHAFDMTNAFNKNHVKMIPYEHCDACDHEVPAIDGECLLCGQGTVRMSHNDIAIRGKLACGFKNESDWKLYATDKDKARLEGYILGAKMGLKAKFY